MLVDTGYDGFNSRDAKRIAAAAKDAGVKQIDYLLGRVVLLIARCCIV